jgi:hypothetical protein
MVERTSALMMALSMLEMISKRQSPMMIRMIDTISTGTGYLLDNMNLSGFLAGKGLLIKGSASKAGGSRVQTVNFSKFI